MPENEIVEKLTSEERILAIKACKNSWFKFMKAAVIIYCLPILVVISVWAFINMPFLYGKLRGIKNTQIPFPLTQQGMHRFAPFAFFLSFIPYFILTLANAILFVKMIPAAYIDLLRSKKKSIRFYPIPYTINDGSYFIKTWIPDYLFIEINYNDFIALDASRLMSLEILPLSRHFLALRYVDNRQIVERR